MALHGAERTFETALPVGQGGLIRGQPRPQLCDAAIRLNARMDGGHCGPDKASARCGHGSVSLHDLQLDAAVLQGLLADGETFE